MKIYRLENQLGIGPFTGNSIIQGIKRHNAPEDMIDEMGMSKASLKRLYKEGYIFGWNSLEKFNNFFNKKGFDEAKSLGFKLTIYERDSNIIEFPDGQIMFLR